MAPSPKLLTGVPIAQDDVSGAGTDGDSSTGSGSNNLGEDASHLERLDEEERKTYDRLKKNLKGDDEEGVAG